jgi:hypothetical protein
VFRLPFHRREHGTRERESSAIGVKIPGPPRESLRHAESHSGRGMARVQAASDVRYSDALGPAAQGKGSGV